MFGVSQKKKVFEIVGVEDPEKIETDMLTTLRSKRNLMSSYRHKQKNIKLTVKPF